MQRGTIELPQTPLIGLFSMLALPHWQIWVTRDNNHYLCLETLVPAIALAFPAGHLVANGDLNSETKISIQQ